MNPELLTEHFIYIRQMAVILNNEITPYTYTTGCKESLNNYVYEFSNEITHLLTYTYKSNVNLALEFVNDLQKNLKDEYKLKISIIDHPTREKRCYVILENLQPFWLSIKSSFVCEILCFIVKRFTLSKNDFYNYYYGDLANNMEFILDSFKRGFIDCTIPLNGEDGVCYLAEKLFNDDDIRFYRPKNVKDYFIL